MKRKTFALNVLIFVGIKLSLLLTFEILKFNSVNCGFLFPESIFFYGNTSWYTITGIVALLWAFSNARLLGRYSKAIISAIAGSVWCVGTAVMLFGLMENFVTLVFAGVLVLSVGSAVMKCLWIEFSLRTSVKDLFYILVVAQIITYGLYAVASLASFELRAVILVLIPAVMILLICQNCVQIEAHLNSHHIFEELHENAFILLGVFASAAVVALLCNASSGFPNKELSIIATLIISGVLFFIVRFGKRPVGAAALLRLIFVLFSSSILFASVFPDRNEITLVTIWGNSCVLSFCVFLLRSQKDMNTHTELPTIAFGLMMLGNTLGLLLGFCMRDVGFLSIVSIASAILLVVIVVADIAKEKTVRHRALDNEGMGDIAWEVEDLTGGYGLTEAEAQVFRSLIKGNSLKHIAEQRCVSYNTIKSQVASIYGKTEVHSKQELLDRFSARPDD
ncbi:MAG: helix-turn-helix transcriptional regulator [Raoultibacter sp.]